jgi:hypothetical protein
VPEQVLHHRLVSALPNAWYWHKYSARDFCK